MKDVNVIKSEIEDGVEQVDNTLTVDSFQCEYDKEKRNLKVKFTAKNSSGETVVIQNTWQ